MKKGWIIAMIVMLIAGTLLLLFRKKIFTKKDSGTDAGTTQTGNVTVSEFPLRSGSRGEKVKKLQRYLNNVLQQAPVTSVPLSVDGIFGPKTAEACGIAFGAEECSEANYKAYIEPYKG